MKMRAFTLRGTVCRFTLRDGLRKQSALHAIGTNLSSAYKRNFRSTYRIVQRSPVFYTVRDKETGKLIMLVEKEKEA